MARSDVLGAGMALTGALRFTASLSVIASALAATSAGAQEVRTPAATSAPASDGATDESNGGLEVITVTARKVSENQQHVPVAITAFSGESLQQQNAVRVQDVARLTPSLSIREGTSTNSTIVLALRGQFQNDVLATLDPSVGTYIDGLYVARTYGLNADLLDLQSVQVLKGPQGTLFGRNTTGGAMLFQTNDPNFKGVSGRFSGTIGNLAYRSGSATLNVPLIGDKLAVRGSVQHIERDGYVTDVGTINAGKSYPGRDTWAARGKILGQLTNNLSVLVSADYFKGEYTGPGPRLGYFVPSGLTTPAPTADILAMAAAGRAAQIAAGVPTANLIPSPFTYSSLANSAPALYAGGNAPLNDYLALLASNKDITATNLTQTGSFPKNQAKTFTLAGTVNLDTYFGAVKFIGGYRSIQAHSDYDLEGSPFVLIDSGNQQNLRQYSGELQITGKAFDRAVDFAAGALYFHEAGTDGSQSRSFAREFLPVGGSTAVASLSTSLNDGTIRNDSMGLYAQATWHITDRLSFTGGGRYSVDDKGITIRTRTFNRSTGLVTCTAKAGVSGIGLDPSACALTRHDSFDGVSYTAGLDYQLTNDVLLYIKTSKGFRSGGQNLRAATPTAFVPFLPEVAYSHEAGLKSEFFDHRLRFNLAGYYSRVNNVQRSSQVAIPGAPPVTIVGNAAKERIWGLEADLTARPVDGLTLFATAALTKAKYLSFSELPSRTNLNGDRSRERLDNIPEKTFSLSGLYEHRFGSANLRLRADYSWTSSYALNSVTYFPGDPFLVTIDTNAGHNLTIAQEIYNHSTAPAAGLLSGQIGVSFLDDTIDVAVFGRNLTNNRGRVLALPVAGINVVSETFREPRTYGVTVTYKFGS